MTSFFSVGLFILRMASTLVGFTSIPWWLTMKPRNLPDGTPKDALLRIEFPAVAPEVG
jgi:hypothetical protein